MDKIKACVLTLVFVAGGLSSPANAEYAEPTAHAPHAPHAPHGRHHLSVLMGDTHVSSEGDSATIGFDYEFRVSPLLGLGAVVERAYGELNATTILGVADIHLHRGLIAQVGPGFEHRSGENVLVARLGVLYEYEFQALTLSPQLHWDWHSGEDNAVVVGIAIGMAF